jgi:hypothetical protein
MINSGRNIVLMLVGVVMVAALVGASQGGADPEKPKQKPAPAATTSPLSWAEVLEQNPDPKVVTDADFLKRTWLKYKNDAVGLIRCLRRRERSVILRS